VLAVGAGAERAQAFLGACRGRLLTALIIGEDVAHEMERLDNSTRQIMEAT
jgi:DNA-binding transcriptional regulator LsrR (DeoR family)